MKTKENDKQYSGSSKIWRSSKCWMDGISTKFLVPEIFFLKIFLQMSIESKATSLKSACDPSSNLFDWQRVYD